MPGSALLLLENFALHPCVTSGCQETPRQRKRFSSKRPVGKSALIFHQAVKRHPCFFPRMNVARLLRAWLAAPFLHSSPQNDTQSWQSLPQFLVAHQTLNAQNWSERSQEELCTERRKQLSVLPVQTFGRECQRR